MEKNDKATPTVEHISDLYKGTQDYIRIPDPISLLFKVLTCKKRYQFRYTTDSPSWSNKSEQATNAHV